VHVLDALGDPTRRAVFERVLDGPRPVGAIARGLPVSRPAVSQHLAVLREARLVTSEADGRRRVYRVDPDGVAALRAEAERFWTGVLAAFKRAAEEER
jgi:DNA-binding transcriptional ArsR family regulator